MIRYVVRRETKLRYAVGGVERAKWSVCDTWNDKEPVGFGIRRYEVRGIARWLNNQNQISPLPKHTAAEPYWEWRQVGDNAGRWPAWPAPQCVRANHRRSLCRPGREAW